MTDDDSNDVTKTDAFATAWGWYMRDVLEATPAGRPSPFEINDLQGDLAVFEIAFRAGFDYGRQS